MMRLILLFILLSGAGFANPSLLSAINSERSDAGRPGLTWSTELEAAAGQHAEDMARHGYFSHTGRNGSGVRDRVEAQRYRGCFWAENIAKGQKDVDAVMASWMASRGHKQNILHRRAMNVGMARAKGNVWVMVLAAPC